MSSQKLPNKRLVFLFRGCEDVLDDDHWIYFFKKDSNEHNSLYALQLEINTIEMDVQYDINSRIVLT